MSFLPGEDAGQAAWGYGADKLSPLLSQVQERNAYKCKRTENRDRNRAGRIDAEPDIHDGTAHLRFIFSGGRKNHER